MKLKKIWHDGVISKVAERGLFYDGISEFEKLFSHLSLSFGVNTKSGALEKDQQRIKNMNNKFQETVKMKKKKVRAVRKGYIGKEKETFRMCSVDLAVVPKADLR